MHLREGNMSDDPDYKILNQCCAPVSWFRSHLRLCSYTGTEAAWNGLSIKTHVTHLVTSEGSYVVRDRVAGGNKRRHHRESRRIRANRLDK